MATLTRNRTWTTTFDMHNTLLTNYGSSYDRVTKYSYNQLKHQSGVTVPGFRELIRTGQQAGSGYTTTGAMIRRFTPREFSIASYYVISPTKTDWSLETYFGHPTNSAPPNLLSIPDMPSSESSDKALSKFYAAYADSQRQFNAAVFAGELRETVRLLKNPLGGLAHLTRDYLHKTRRVSRNSRKQAKQLADAWLAYNFGIKPLISDIKSLVEIGSSKEDSVSRYKKIFGVDDYPYSNRSVFPGSSYYGWPVTNYYQVRGSNRVRFYGVAACRQLRGNDAGVALGLDVTNFVPTLYELMPWSFFIDYFSNLGQVIEAWSANTVNLLWACRSRSSRYSRFWTCQVPSGSSSGGGVTRFMVGSTSIMETETWAFDRTAYTKTNPLPLPGLVLNLGLSSRQLANTAALFLNRFT